MRRIGAALVTVGALWGTAACGNSFAESEAAGTTSAAPTTEEEETASPSSSSSAATTSSTPTSASSSPGGPLDADDAGRRLTLEDFFNPSPAWEEQRFDIADQRQVPGIAAVIDGCYEAHELELRLGNDFETLEFSVGQSNDSEVSDQEVSVEVLANNAQVEIRSVPFNEVQSFSIPVAGVNALRIVVMLDDRVPDCGGSVNAVITDTTLE